MSNTENVEIAEYPVTYPIKEKAYAFVPHSRIPFESAALGITYPDPSYTINRKSSGICLFEYVIDGEGEVFINGKWTRVGAGDFYIMPSGIDHIYRSLESNPWTKLWINYSSDYMASFLRSYGIEGGIFHSESVRGYFEELVALPKSDGLSQEIYFRIADRLHKIVRIAATLNNDAADDDYGMRRILSGYVHKKLNLDELAEQLHMSKSNLIRIFKKKYKVTPYEYVISLRIETAKIFLRDTKLTIKEIADKLVFFDEHYFSSVFLKKVGLRPGAYRTSVKDER